MSTPTTSVRKLGTFTLAAVLTMAVATQSQAAKITSNNYDTIQASQGGLVISQTSEFFSAPNRRGEIFNHGSLTVSVFEQSGLFTYVLDVTPTRNNVKAFSTAFEVFGFNGVAGYSFSDVTTAGGSEDPGNDIEVNLDDAGELDFLTRSDFWDTGEQISFFFQSTSAPTEIDIYGILSGRASETENIAPGREGDGEEPVIPAPAALPAGIALLSACGLWGRFRKA